MRVALPFLLTALLGFPAASAQVRARAELVPLPGFGGTEIVATPDGAAWTVGGDAGRERNALYELTAAGELREVPTALEPGWQLTYGPGGAIWMESRPDWIIRFDPATRTSFAIEVALPHVFDLRTGPDGNLWVLGLESHGSSDVARVTRVSPQGVVLGTKELPRRMDYAATAGAWFWMAPGWPYDDHAIYRMSAGGELTRHPLPFVPLALFAAADVVWITSREGRGVLVDLDMRIIREAALRGVTDAAVDHDGALWVGYTAGLLKFRRDGVLLQSDLPRLPDATCSPSWEPRRMAFTDDASLVMTGNYAGCSGPCPPYEPCVAAPPADFLMRVNVEGFRLPPRRRSVRR
jgi:hypothetical protein